MQNGKIGPRHKTAAVSQDREDIRGVPQEGFVTGVRKASDRDFQRVAESEELDCVEGSALFETEEEHTSILGVRIAGNVGTQVTRVSFAPPFGKEKLWVMMMYLDLLPPYQGTARDKRP
jgi:hypothetical protein